MILDALCNWEQYAALHPRFQDAFGFLSQPGLCDLPNGRVEIDGARVYAIVLRETGKGKSGAQLETHRKYLDIQFTLSGPDVIGWSARTSCQHRGKGYDSTKDVELFSGKPDVWVDVPDAHFALFWPEDAHAPLAARTPVHKVVVKIAVD